MWKEEHFQGFQVSAFRGLLQEREAELEAEIATADAVIGEEEAHISLEISARTSRQYRPMGTSTSRSEILS